MDNNQAQAQSNSSNQNKDESIQPHDDQYSSELLSLEVKPTFSSDFGTDEGSLNNNKIESEHSSQSQPRFQVGDEMASLTQQQQQQQQSDFVTKASAAVVEAAVALKRSDSILSESEGSATSLKQLPNDSTSRTSQTAIYMEEASMEALLQSPHHHHIAPSGSMGRRRAFAPSQDTITIRLGGQDPLEAKSSSFLEDQESYIEEAEAETETDTETDTEKNCIQPHSAMSANDDIQTPTCDDLSTDGGIKHYQSNLDTIFSADSNMSNDTPTEYKKLSTILESCGLLLSSPQNHHDKPDDDDDSAHFLFLIFQNFCSPSIQLQSVEAIIQLEDNSSNQVVSLPTDVVIEKPATALTKLIGPPMLHLPKIFSLSLMRILLRLLTNETDLEYNKETLRSCDWSHDIAGSNYNSKSTTKLQSFLTRQRTSSTSSLKRQSSFSDKSFNRDNVARRADQMYTMVRLQRNWRGAVLQSIKLLDSLINQRKNDYLIAPIIRLLGLLCTGGVSVDELRLMLSMAEKCTTVPLVQLLLVRALTVAADGASRSSLLVGKASPRQFFSFGCGSGISRMINLHDSQWPFKNDFGMALWFRAERFSRSSVLLRVTNENGSGIEISLLPLESNSSSATTATVLTVRALQDAKCVQSVKVNGCALLPRVWYHVAVRHTRSRLKGVFSLASREQISIMLDGKTILNENFKFTNFHEPPKSLRVTFGSNFDGQTGALYLFHENVSDATFRALYEVTSGTGGVVQKRASAHDEWDARRGDIVRKSKLLDLSIRQDDAEEIVLSQRANSRDSVSHVSTMDLEEEDDGYENNPLSRFAFGARLYIVWDPRRTEGDFLLELHTGSHVRMDPANVQSWFIEGAQDVVGSLGGVQSILPVFQALLAGGIESLWKESINNKYSSQATEQPCLDYVTLCSLIPDLLALLAAFVRDHGENSREMLRCGGIDVVESFLKINKDKAVGQQILPIKSLVGSLSVSRSLANRLTDELLKLRSACSHYAGLETKVFTRLLFNLPLWFGGVPNGMSLYPTLLAVISSVTRTNPEKVRDCIGVKDMVQLLHECINSKFLNISGEGSKLFEKPQSGNRTHLTIDERRHVVDVLLGMIFQVLGSGTIESDLSLFLHLLSSCLESEWNEASREIANGGILGPRTGVRQERYRFSVRASTVLLLLLQCRPGIPNFYESFARTCGSVQGGAAWIISSMVNSYCDEIRSIGVLCIVTYVNMTSKSPDSTLSLEKSTTVMDVENLRQAEGLAGSRNNMQVGTLSLISNVSRGFAAMGPNAKQTTLLQSRLTPRVIYKLLWHLLKSHRYRLGTRTQSSLLRMVMRDDSPTSTASACTSFMFLRDNFLAVDGILGDGVLIDMKWADLILSEQDVNQSMTLNDFLGVDTLLRLLRYLPNNFQDQWLEWLLALASGGEQVLSIISQCRDWQPCLFQLVSEIVEHISSLVSPNHSKPDNIISNSTIDIDSTAVTNEANSRNKLPKITESQQVDEGQSCDVLQKRLDMSLDLYSALLGYLFRTGSDKALDAMENAASLQRVCLNGNEVFSLVLSRLLSNLAVHGTIPRGEDTVGGEENLVVQSDYLLKRSARLVTESILSNGTSGLNLPSAVGCWRCLRHLSAVTVSVVTKSGFGITELFDYRNHHASATDKVSNGLNGIRLPDSNIEAITATDFVKYSQSDSGKSDSTAAIDANDSEDSGRERRVYRRICVTLAAQLLFLLDAFIFPDSLDASLPASQLHGLALVRSTEKRIGSAQGPLLASAVRLSLLLICHLEPCSVKLLQCASRLRCFLHWMLELIRESEALEGYSAAFNELTAPLDRLILATVLQCHRTLGRCTALLGEIESSAFSKYFESKESQRKYFRRLLRVALELRDIVLTAYKGRGEVLRASLASMAFADLETSLDASTRATDDQQSQTGKGGAAKEIVIRAMLSSEWVTRYQDVDIRDGIAFPEQITDLSDNLLQERVESRGCLAIRELASESGSIITQFEKSLNRCFEKYLESQRIWAETGAVRDLEFEGDTALKLLSSRHSNDVLDYSKLSIARASAAVGRWNGIQAKLRDLWKEGTKWMLGDYLDRLGRRILLVQNRQFDDHEDARYEQTLGMDSRGETIDSEEQLRTKQELSDLMKRNTDAFVLYGAGDEHEVDDEEQENENEIDISADDDQLLQTPETSINDLIDESGIDLTESLADNDEVVVDMDVDKWAKSFIWSDNESVVARFESVMIVTLQFTIEGKLLLTTHGIYFQQTGDEINVMTKEVRSPINVTESNNNGTDNRRWKLSRLTEVLGRRYMLRSQALELFFSEGRELFLNFLGGAKERDRFHAKLRNSCKIPMLASPKTLNPKAVYKKSKLTELWRKRKMSNFEYLMALNKMAGRTFNDISQYPVFPWILADYSSKTLDLSDSRVYRDLTKPVGALNPDRLAQLLERYNELESFGFSESEKFLYGSHYSSPGMVLHFLLRQEPFTSMAIDLQSGRFDCPDRLFFDIGESWKGCNTSSSDVKELIPEFFTLPEMFLNTNKFSLGKTQKGQVVDDVGLPPWANGSAYEFVRIHRLALESEYVSRNLHRWIDLIFGYQQRGPPAEAAHNVFHHLSYEGAVDLDKITDDLDRQAAESHIQNFGQTPSQLIVKEPHPARYSTEESWKPLIYDLSMVNKLGCFTPPRQFGGKKSGPSAVAKIHVQSDSIIVIHTDLSVATYKWLPKNKRNPLKADKIRLIPNRAVSNSRAAIRRGTATPQTMNECGSWLAVGNWSFAVTIGGYEKEQLRRKAIMPSRLATAKDALYTDAPSFIVSCGYWDNTVKVHSMDGLRLECSETGGHRGPIRCLAVGDDGGLLVTGGQDATCRVWVLDHPDLAIALSDAYIQTAIGQSNDGEQTLSCCHVLWGHETPITCLDLCSDLDVTVSGSFDGLVCVHTIRRGEFIRSFRPAKIGRISVAKLSVVKIVMDSHGKIVVHMNDGGLHVYTVNGVLLCCRDAGELLHDMKVSGETLVSGGNRCSIVIRHMAGLQIISTLDLSRHGPIRCISFAHEELNPIPQSLFVGSDDGTITIIENVDY